MRGNCDPPKAEENTEALEQNVFLKLSVNSFPQRSGNPNAQRSTTADIRPAPVIPDTGHTLSRKRHPFLGSRQIPDTLHTASEAGQSWTAASSWLKRSTFPAFELREYDWSDRTR